MTGITENRIRKVLDKYNSYYFTSFLSSIYFSRKLLEVSTEEFLVLRMGLSRLYFYVAAIALTSFLCASHIKLEWPEKGWHPHSSMGNVWRKEKAHNAKQQQKREGPRPSHRERQSRDRAKDPRRHARREWNERDSDGSDRERRASGTRPSRSSATRTTVHGRVYDTDPSPIARWR